MNNIIEITDFENKELDVYARLTEAQLLNNDNIKEGIFIAESPKVIERALAAGCEPISALIEDKHIEGEGKEIIKKLNNVNIYTAKFDVLTKLTGFQLTRGMLCAMKRPPLPKAEDICKNATRIAILENVMNPTNVGAIFRCAAALNIDAVLLTRGCANPLYRRAIRVSMGTVFQIPWTFIDNNVNWNEFGIEYIHNLGFKSAAMALRKDTVAIDDGDLNKEKRLAIILGTEGEGLTEGIIDKSDYTIKIPMANGVDSLNVAAASAVAFWQLGNRNK